MPLPGFSLTALQAQFDLGTGVVGSWSFTVTTAPPDQPPEATTWRVIPGVLEVREITLVMQIAIVRPGGKGTPQTQITGSLTGIVHVGGTVDVRVVIPIPVTQEWIFATAGAVVLPNLRDLAKLVAGVDPGTLLPPGAGAIGDFTLTSIVLTLDPVEPALVVFSFTLVSTNDWVIVPPDRLRIKDLQLSFQIDEPFGLRTTSGIIAGTVRIGAWDIDVVIDRQPYELDWNMQVSSAAMPLPGIGDLDRLAGTSLAPYLPQTLATASFTLYDLLIDVNLSQPTIRQLAVQLDSDQPWTIIQDILVIERAGLYIDLSWFAGDLLANFGVWGALRVVNTGIEVSADRVGAGEWTFRGALAAGETIALGGLVAQFLRIDPAYLPSLEVEGLAATFSTPSNDYAFEGRTAGLWTFEVSSALTLRMRAEAAFQRTAGETSGHLAGDFFINNLNVFVSYAFDPASSTLLFRLTYGRLSLTAALTSGTNAQGQAFSLLSFRLGDLSFGEILEGLINLASPGNTFRLQPPWDALNQINLRNLSLVVDLKTREVTVNYDIALNLAFVDITGIGVKYDTSSGEGGVRIQLSGRLLDQEYSLARGNPLEWDVLHEPAPSVPAKGPELFDLKYLGLGQRVSFSDLAALNTVGEVIAAMRAQMTPVKDATRNPLATGNGSAMRFDRASGILAGADFEILSTLSATFVFNDPYLYGMRLALAGERAASLAGLAFELLYKKVTNDIGVFKIELRVPDAFRQLEFGTVSVTLPIIKVEVYTNGNFRVDLGFPHGGDFSCSFCLQVFPFIGWGGFYFAALTGATSERVPRVTNGSFDPVIEAGLGLQVGLGKEIRKGPLSGGMYVTVIGILEGTVAWFTSTDIAARDGTYYWIEGSIGIVGKVYGQVDFAVIKVSVRLEARLTVWLVLEAYEVTHLQVTVDVEADASVKIFFVRIAFSFSVSLHEEFVIGSRSTPPWLVAPPTGPVGEQPRLRMQETRWRSRSRLRELRLRARSVTSAGATWTPWDPILVFATKLELPLTLLPALTVATPTGSGQPALQIAFVLLAENGVAPMARTRVELRRATATHSSRTADPMALSFNLLVEAMLQWAIYSVTGSFTGTVTAGDLERAYALLEDEATFNNGFAYTNLATFFASNFNVHISGLPANLDSADETSGTVMAMLPPLSFTHDSTQLHFDTYNPVSPQYEADVRRYYAQLLVDYEYGRAQDPAPALDARATRQRLAETAAGDESMATLIFREYMMIVAKSAVQAARDCLTRFAYPVTATDSLNTIAAQFPAVPLPEIGATLAVTPETIAFANRQAPVTADTQWSLTDLAYQINAGDSLGALAMTFKLMAAADLITVAANATNRHLLAVDATVTIAQPASTDYTWFTYTSVGGDGLLSIAVWAFVRARPADPQPNRAWYAQTIVNFNTNPQQPYAGPNLAGVIATGTSLLVPAALNDSDPTHALTYVTRTDDTLDFVACYYDVLQNAPQLLQTLTTGLQTLNPGVDWAHLPPGTAIHVPAQTYAVVPGDSLASIAARFLLTPTDLAYGRNATATTLLAPLAVLALPAVTYTTGASDTIAGVAEKFNTTVSAIAAAVAAVPALFRYPLSLTIPDVPAYPISALVRAIVLGQHANEVAMAVSRFVASGLRLPTPQSESALDALYVLTGQQQPCPTPPATFTFTSSVSWIDFVGSAIATPGDTIDALRARDPRFDTRNPLLREQPLRAGMHLLLGDGTTDLSIVVTQAFLDTYAPSTTFDPHILSGPSPLDIKRRTPVTYRLDRSMHWQTPQAVPFAGTGAAPLAGEPSIWLFPDTLERRGAALGWGTTSFVLFAAAGDPAITPTTDPIKRYDWATLINLSVRQTPATRGEASLPNTYEIASTDADSKARLLALLSYLTETGQTDTAQVFILYTPNAGTNNPHGLASASVDAASTFILRANLSTLTASGPHGAVLSAAPKDKLYAATLAQATDFIQLLWEASVTASGGYFLNYTDASGNGLPNDVFAATSLGELRILVLLASQSADTSPNRKLYAFNNCALVGDNIDAGVQTVFAAVDDATKVEWRESASIPPGNAGFTLTRTNPGTADNAEQRTQQLYSLLAYHSVASDGFAASNEGLPVSPVRPERTPATLIDAPWQYTQVLRLGKLTTSTLPDAPFVPSAAADPYAGIAPSAKVTLAMDFHDVYGNETISQAPITNLDVPVGYYDDVIGVAQWPGLAASYHVGGSATAPAIEIDAALQVSNYVPGGGASFDAAQKSASAHQARLGAIYYQIWQDGISITLTTSLVQEAGKAPRPFTVDRLVFANFVSACYIFLGAVQQLQRAWQTAGAGTLASVARSLTANASYLSDAIGALGVSNQDAPTASLFAASLAMPVLDLTAFGDALTAIVTRAGAPTITVGDLATNNAVVLLNAGIDIMAPGRTSAPVTAQTRLIDVGQVMHALPGAIGDANATVRGLLAAGAPVTVSGVAIVVEVDPTSGKTWSFADLEPKFADLGVTATPAIMAVANQTRAGLFAIGQTLIVRDYILQPGDTFTSLAQAYPAFTIAALATAAADSPNVFPTGLPLFIRAGAAIAPSPTQTLRTLADTSHLTVQQIALANQQTALVSTAALWLPDRVTIDATAAASLTAYTVPSAGIAIATIVQSFAEASALAFATRNWALRYVFVPQQTVAVGTASTSTQTNDSFASVYDRLHAQDRSITQAQFVATIAQSTTLTRAGALFAVVLPSTGTETTALQTLAQRFGTDPASIAQVNASLVGFIVAQVRVQLGALSLTTGPNETFTNLVLRFAQEHGIQTTVAAIARENLTTACLAAQQRFVLPPASLTTTVALPAPPATGPPYPGNPFALFVDLTIARDANRIDPQFASVASVAAATVRLAPQTTATSDGGALSLDAFAQALELVYPALKVAVGGEVAGGEVAGGGARDVWIVNFGPGGVTSVAIDDAKPSFFALPPLATSLQDLAGVAIRRFDPSTGKLTPQTDPPLFDVQSIDLDIWAGICFAAIDQLLTPAYAGPAFLLNATAFSQLVDAKQALAQRVSAGVTSILTGSSGRVADAAERIHQQLLVSLAAGYAMTAVVQYPVQVTSGFTVAGAPRLLCEMLNDVFRTGATDDLAMLGTRYDVPQAALAMLLGEAVRVLAIGTAFTFKGSPYAIEEADTIVRLMVRVGATGYQDFVFEPIDAKRLLPAAHGAEHRSHRRRERRCVRERRAAHARGPRRLLPHAAAAARDDDRRAAWAVHQRRDDHRPEPWLHRHHRSEQFARAGGRRAALRRAVHARRGHPGADRHPESTLRDSHRPLRSRAHALRVAPVARERRVDDECVVRCAVAGAGEEHVPAAGSAHQRARVRHRASRERLRRVAVVVVRPADRGRDEAVEDRPWRGTDSDSAACVSDRALDAWAVGRRGGRRAARRHDREGVALCVRLSAPPRRAGHALRRCNVQRPAAEQRTRGDRAAGAQRGARAVRFRVAGGQRGAGGARHLERLARSGARADVADVRGHGDRRGHWLGTGVRRGGCGSGHKVFVSYEHHRAFQPGRADRLSRHAARLRAQRRRRVADGQLPTDRLAAARRQLAHARAAQSQRGRGRLRVLGGRAGGPDDPAPALVCAARRRSLAERRGQRAAHAERALGQYRIDSAGLRLQHQHRRLRAADRAADSARRRHRVQQRARAATGDREPVHDSAWRITD